MKTDGAVLAVYVEEQASYQFGVPWRFPVFHFCTLAGHLEIREFPGCFDCIEELPQRDSVARSAPRPQANFFGDAYGKHHVVFVISGAVKEEQVGHWFGVTHDRFLPCFLMAASANKLEQFSCDRGCPGTWTPNIC
jgi:hypothetical protein